MRNPVACVSCRSAKQKCLHNDVPPCDRCKAAGRADLCEFPPPGTSAIHRRPKRPRQEDGPTPPAASGVAQPYRTASGSEPTTASALSPAATASLLDGLDPFDLLTDEVVNSYLRCSYKWSFHHTPTLLLRIRDRTLEPWMVWAMLALAVRFVREPPVPFRTQIEASNAFAAHARQILQPDLETPSISRVQALLMLTGHDWGAGNGRRAWIYLGMAIRLIEVMDITAEPKVPRNRKPTREEFVDAEVRRRTAWTCFLMDSLLSGGRGRKRSLAASDMAIQLPCERENFVFGEPVCTQRLDGSIHMPPLSLNVGELGIIAHSLRVANIWGKVARWACSEELKIQLPWSPSSQFQQLTYELGNWKNSLPERLQYELFLLHSHNAVDQGQAYCYMHCIYFMSTIFLHRAYLPVLGPQNTPEDTLVQYNDHRERWQMWQRSSRRDLFIEASMVLDMLEEMRNFGVFFLRGLVPWIGFTIYSAVGVMLFSYNFPSSDDDPGVTEKARERVIRGCTFLKEMKNQWPMSDTWFETIKRMQAYYRSVLGQDGPVSSDERQVLRRAMVDYGALQPSPVQKPVDTKPPADSTVIHSSISNEVGGISHPTSYTVNLKKHASAPTNGPAQPQMISPPDSAPNSYAPMGWNEQQTIPPLEDDEAFMNFDFSNADMEEIMRDATQEFWASFPGEVGVGY